MRILSLVILTILFFGCSTSSEPLQSKRQEVSCASCNISLSDYFNMNSWDTIPSIAIGTPGNGSLQHGKLIPPRGKNFIYFDSASYMRNRGFTHSIIREVLLNTYECLDVLYPGRTFRVMEASNQKGGEISPHRTHQNGLSIDLMFPKLKNGIPYEKLDTLGFSHYLLDFNEKGQYKQDASITIDFATTAHHIYLLALEAEKLGYEIEKVLVYTEFKDELFSTVYGKKLKEMGVYFAQYLEPKINKLHDDHFHIDFKAKLTPLF